MHSSVPSIGLDSRMLISPRARSHTIRIAHIGAPENRLALSTSFKLRLRAGCLVLTGLNKNQAD